MDFVNDIKEIRRVANSILAKHRVATLSVDDLISEAFIATNGEAELGEIKRVMTEVVYSEKDHASGKVSQYYKTSKSESVKVCTKCKEEYPAHYFRVHSYSKRSDHQITYCKKCEQAYIKEYNRTENGKKLIKKYREKQMQDLPDWYIIRQLKKEGIEITKKAIEEKRHFIKLKRLRLKTGIPINVDLKTLNVFKSIMNKRA